MSKPQSEPTPAPDTKFDPDRLVAGLVRLLKVERDPDSSEGEDRFIGRRQPGGLGRVFGGQVIAQGLDAAQQTVGETKHAHSLHAYFLRGGREGIPIHYDIARDFDGRSFANRRVVASQTDKDGKAKAILNLTASFQTPEDGMEHLDSPMPDVAPPEELTADMDVRRKIVERAGERMTEQQRAMMTRPRPIDMRTVDRLHWMNSEPTEPNAHTWFRTIAPLPPIEQDPMIHRAVIAYASDYTLLGTSALPHGLSWARGELVGASLDHAIWFHAPARADDWLLYATDSPWSGSGRGFNRGRIFTRDGTLVASVAQEGMMRKRVRKTP